ncbi:MAG: hypothetical protein N3C12_13015 [Candidatus Binatia bacterium]|nr:hypothetical protein [Candidatus Binatia bacterium]
MLDIGGLALNGQPQPGSVNSTFANGPVTIAGQVATALYFFSGAELVEVPHSPLLDLAQKDLTIDAWFAAFLPNAPGFGGVPDWSPGQARFYAIVDKADAAGNAGYALFLRTMATSAPPNPPQNFPVNVFVDLCFQQGSSGVCAPIYSGTALYDVPTMSFLPPVPPWPFGGQWLHVAVTVDRGASLGVFYLNGNVLGSFAPAAGVSDSTVPLWIGKSRLPNNGFEFGLDEVEIFNRALTSPEIASIAGFGGKCKTPTASSASPSLTATPTPTSTLSASTTSTHTRTASSTATATVSPPLTRTPTQTITPTFEGECRFVGPRMCGGTCPNPNEVCRPKPDDSGCECMPGEPLSPTATPTSGCPGAVCTATPTHTATLPIATPSLTITPTPTASSSPTRIPSPTGTATSRPTATATNSPTATPRASNTPTATVSATPTSRPSLTPSRTPCFAEVCVTKFWDLNGNGQNDGEPGLGGWTIQFLDANNNVVSSVVTLAGGTICTGIPAAAPYTVQEVLQGSCVQTFPSPPGTHSVFIECGQVLNLQFGNRCPLPTLPATPSRTATGTATVTRTPTASASATRTSTRSPTSIVPPID